MLFARLPWIVAAAALVLAGVLAIAHDRTRQRTLEAATAAEREQHRLATEVARLEAENATLRGELLSFRNGRNEFPIDRITRPIPPSRRLVALERFPNIHAERRVEIGREFSVIVSLSDERETRDVTVDEGERGPHGGLMMRLPAATKKWRIDVVLSAPEFDLLTRGEAVLTLPRSGASDSARFRLRAPVATGRYAVWVMFYAQPGYMGKAVKWIDVVPKGAIASGGSHRNGAIDDQSSRTVAAETADGLTRDLEVLVRWGPKPLQDPIDLLWYYPVEIHVSSPRFGNGIPKIDRHQRVPADLAAWLESQYRRVLARAGRGFTLPGEGAPGRDAAIAEARALGINLWWKYVPEPLRRAIVDVDREAQKEHPDRPRLLQIQIITNSPTFPWELLSFEDAWHRERHFLGMQAALARAHETNELSLAPPLLTLPFFRTLEPRYAPPLPPMPGGETPSGIETVKIGGTRADVQRQLSGNAPLGLVHFAGHGKLVRRGEGPDDVDYAIVLEGGDLLTASQWPGLAVRRLDPFFVFLNACDLGQAERAGGRVEGWAPAMIASGAIGYIGGLWPIGVESGRDFAQRFYGRALAPAGRLTVAEALAAARGRFLDTGDPTYLAYVYYGNTRLRLDIAATPMPSAEPWRHMAAKEAEAKPRAPVKAKR